MSDFDPKFAAQKMQEELEELASSVEKQMNDFSEIMSSIDTLETKKKLLWQHIYANSLNDRKNSYTLFLELYIATRSTKSVDHQLNGPVMVKYIERMQRSNDQILKLAELIEKAAEDSNKINPDKLFEEIKGSK